MNKSLADEVDTKEVWCVGLSRFSLFSLFSLREGDFIIAFILPKYIRSYYSSHKCAEGIVTD